jgi:hypothetical protein
VATRAFDTESPRGTLKRFHPDVTEIVDISNGDLAELGISRQTKYRALTELQEVGAVTIEPHNGRSVRVTLHWFP